MISIDFTALFFLLSFVAFILVLNIVFFKPVFANIEARESVSGDTKQGIDSLESRLAERFHLLESDHTLAEAKTKANALINEARSEALGVKEGLVHRSAQELSIKVEELVSAVDYDKRAVIDSASLHVQQIVNVFLEKLDVTVLNRESSKSSQGHSLV